MLDKLLTDERSHILVTDNSVDGDIEILLLRLLPEQYEPVQQRLGTSVMVILSEVGPKVDCSRKRTVSAPEGCASTRWTLMSAKASNR
jgi:hypothetical protein